MILEIAVYVVFSIMTFFLWTTIHELSHIAAAMIVGNVEEWSIKPYPNKAKDGHWRFASASWIWKGGAPSLKRQGMVNVAPMFSSTFAISLVSITFFLTGIAKMLMLIFCAGAVINLISGSTGLSEFSDLKRASKRLSINKWIIRVGGFATAAVGAFLVLLSLFT